MTWCFSQKHGPYAESLERAFPGVSTLLTNGASRFLFLKGKLKVLEAFPKPLKDSYEQTNKQNVWIQRNPDFSNVQGKWKLVLITGSSKTRRFYKKNTYLSSGTWQEVKLLLEWHTVRNIFSLIVLKRGVTGAKKSPHTPNLGRGWPDISGVKTHAGIAQTQSDVST